MHRKIADRTVDHYLANCRGAGLSEEHMKLMEKKRNDMSNALQQHVQNLMKPGKGGFIPYNADKKGAAIVTGGGFTPLKIPQDRQTMYHMLLQLNPHQLEMFREIASQLLGGRPSQMWGPMAGGSFGDKMHAPAQDYENIIRMPNVHAAARLLEAENEMGGGFAKALRHVGKIAHRVYKAGSHVVRWAGANKDLLEQMVPDSYKPVANSLLSTAQTWDNAITPLVDATYNALKSDAKPEDRHKFMEVAGNSLEKAIKEYKPEYSKYVDSAKQMHSNYTQLKNSYNKSKQI